MNTLTISNEEFAELRKVAEQKYHSFRTIYCPYFRSDVSFNTEGFRHLLFKSWNRGRSRLDQFMRLKFIAWAPEILRLTRTVQGVEETHEWQRQKKHGRWEKLMVPVTYYEFVAVMEKRRFKVIVKQLNGGALIFWSLIPYWRQTDEGKRLLHEGTPALD